MTDAWASASGSTRVSIVVPTYNRERYISATLDSVLAQTMSRWELVVFDDGSTDATADVVNRYIAADPRIRVVHGPNGGVAAARNRGFAATDRHTEFVIFLDSDDLWLSDTLQALVGVLDGTSDLVSAYGLARCIDGDGRPIAGDDLEDRMGERTELRGRRFVELFPDQPLTFAALAHHNWVVTPGTHLIRRTIAERVGGFDSTVDPADDWDHVIRISRHGDIGFLPRVVLHWRRHPDTLTMTSPRWKRAFYGVRAKMLHDPTNTTEQRHVAHAGYHQHACSALAAAREAVAARQVTGALRHTARSAETGVRYVRAAALLALRRVAG